MSDSGSINKQLDIKDRHATDVGRQNLTEVVPPHESYEGYQLWDVDATWTSAEEKTVVRIIDFRLLTMLCLMFLGLQLDRGNLGNAVTDNMLKDLRINTNDYNNGSSIQLVCFLATEFPFQMLIKRYGFRTILPGLMTCWSLVSVFQCFIKSRWSFYLTRAFIGAFEGGFIPGTILYCTYFYTSAELAIRLALFWSTLNVARIVSALLAAGILEMRGVHGWAGWRYLFMIEGCITLAIAGIAFLALPGSPVATRGVFSPKGWFTPKQEVIAINRVLRDDSSKGLTGIAESLTWADIKAGWCDNSMWGMYMIGLVAYIPAAPVSGYLSLTLKTLGFSTFDSNMLTIPAAVLQIILMLALAFSSEFYGERTFHCFFGEIWSLPSLIAIETLPDGGRNWPRFSLSTLISGYPYAHPIVSSWISENSFSIRKRAVTAATYNVVVQIESVISSQIYRQDDKPYYHRGNKVLIAICCLACATFVCQRQYLKYLNSKKLEIWEGMSEKERIVYQNDTVAREAEGNKRLDFMFIY